MNKTQQDDFCSLAPNAELLAYGETAEDAVRIYNEIHGIKPVKSINLTSTNPLDCDISATIEVMETPLIEDTHTISFVVDVQGYDCGVIVTWIREYPRHAGFDVNSEWDTPVISVGAIDAENGFVGRAARLASFDTILDVTDQYFDMFLKGK